MNRFAIAVSVLLFTAPLCAHEPEPSAKCAGCHAQVDIAASGAHGGHPIAVDYRMVKRFGRIKLHEPSQPSGFGATVEKDLLVDGKVECTSCHLSHQEETTNRARLRVPADAMTKPGAASLCIACHDLS